MSDRPLCNCGNLCKPNGISKKDGRKLYNSYCRSCAVKKHGGRNNLKRYRNKTHKKDKCDNCSFVPVNLCQLDLDHIDGNNNNYSPENLQTLCANCHRLKTYLSKDWLPTI